MYFSQNTHHGEFFVFRRIVLRGRVIERAGHRPAWDSSLSRNRFPRNETPKEPVRSGYKYPDVGDKYILETLYFRQTVNNRPRGSSEKRTAVAVMRILKRSMGDEIQSLAVDSSKGSRFSVCSAPRTWFCELNSVSIARSRVRTPSSLPTTQRIPTILAAASSSSVLYIVNITIGMAGLSRKISEAAVSPSE